MPENNVIESGATSSPAPVAASAPEKTSDAITTKGNVTGSQVRKYLTESFMAREADAKPAEPAERSSSIAADKPETLAAPEETPKTSATPEATSKAEQTEEASDVPFNLTHLTDQKTRETVEAELRRFKESSQSSIDSRIGKEVGKRKALEAEVERLRGQVRSPVDPQQQQAAQAAPQAPFPQPVPFSNIADPSVLQKEAQQARLFHSLADDAIVAGPTGQRIDESGRKVDLYSIEGAEYTKDQVMNIRRNAREAFQVGIPARLEDMRLRNQNRQQAETSFPWIRDPSSPDFQRAQAVANAMPFMRNLPNSENLIGLIVEGLKATETRQAQGKKPAARATGSPPGDQVSFSGVGRAATRAPANSLTQQAMEAEMAKLNGKKGVSGRDVRKFLLATDQLRKSR